MALAQSKTDLDFKINILNQENMKNIDFIIKTIKSVDFAIGSKGKPTVEELCSALKESQNIHKSVASLIDNPNQLDALNTVNSLSEKVSEIRENTVEAIRSKSYGFYTQQEKEGLSENNKRIDDIKNRAMDALALAYKLKLTPGLEKSIDTLIKTVDALSLMPYAKNGPDQPKILDGLEQVVGLQTKAIQQEGFRQHMKEEPSNDLHTKEPQVNLENQQQPE